MLAMSKTEPFGGAPWGAPVRTRLPPGEGSGRVRNLVEQPILVENTGIEPVTSWLQTRRSPS